MDVCFYTTFVRTAQILDIAFSGNLEQNAISCSVKGPDQTVNI